MNNETIEKARRTRLQNKLRRDIADSKWTLRGTEFSRFEWQGLYGEYKFGCWFYCNLKRVRVHIYGVDAFNLPDLDKTFSGETAWDKCIEWTTERIVEMTDVVLKNKEKLTQQVDNQYFRKVFKGE